MQMLTSRLRRAWGIQAYLRHATVSTKIVGDSRSMVSPIPRQICTLSRLPLYNRHQYTRYPPARRVCMSSNVTPVVVRDSTVKSLEGILMHTFKDRRLLVEAMTHRSVLNAKSSIGDIVFEDENGIMSNIEQNNEVLEHVGDRVFALLVSETLYKLNLFQSEGAMSALGHSLLSGKKADSYCEALDLKPFLLQSEVLRNTPGSRFGDFFEALLGALFVDGGFEAASHFFTARVVPIWNSDDLSVEQRVCHKRTLQEYLVACGLPATALGTKVRYVPIKVEAYDGRQSFTQAVELFGRKVSAATGATKISADQTAARKLLDVLKRTKTTCLLIRLARKQDDQVSLAKLQAKRAEQVAADKSQVACDTTNL